MNVLLVTFRLPGIDAAAYRLMASTAATSIAAAPGLVSKTWLADEATNTYGELVVFESAAAAESYLNSQVFGDLRANPRLTTFNVDRFGTLEAASRLTRGLLPIAAESAAASQASRPATPKSRRRVIWRNHGGGPSVADDFSTSEATWEDAAWQ